MDRSLKKTLYALLYLSIIGGIGFWSWSAMNTIPPSCSDNIQNQGETGVDCGGPCIACEIKALSPLTQMGKTEIFTIGGVLEALMKVANPNTTHHAIAFSYAVNVRDRNGEVVESIPGVETLFAREARYILVTGLTTPTRNIASISVDMQDPNWRSASEVVPPALALSDVKTTVGKTDIRVSGTVKNGSTFAARNVKIVAVLRTKGGSDVGASQQIITNVAGFTTQSFTVLFPFDTTLSTNVDPKGTLVSVSGQ